MIKRTSPFEYVSFTIAPIPEGQENLSLEESIFASYFFDIINIAFQKGCGYHLDMLIVGVTIGVSSILGLPWCVAATVLCLGNFSERKNKFC